MARATASLGRLSMSKVRSFCLRMSRPKKTLSRRALITTCSTSASSASSTWPKSSCVMGRGKRSPVTARWMAAASDGPMSTRIARSPSFSLSTMI